MSTQPIVVSQTWAEIGTGPLTVSLQLDEGSPGVYIAVNSSVPTTNTGHLVPSDFVMNVELDAGETLYALCRKGNGFLIMT